MVKKSKKPNIITRGLIGIGNIVDSGVKKYQANKAYKESPEYKKKVLNDLAFQEELLKRQARINKIKASQPKPKNPFQQDGDMWRF